MSTPSTIPVSAAPRKSRRHRYWIGGFVLLVLATPFAYFHFDGKMRDRELEEIYREMDAEDPHDRRPSGRLRSVGHTFAPRAASGSRRRAQEETLRIRA